MLKKNHNSDDNMDEFNVINQLAFQCCLYLRTYE